MLIKVIQVFLVTALSSSASAVVTQIINDPGSATSLLATNLPKSSNFYICWLLLQGLSIAGSAFIQIVGLILFYLLGKMFDNTPRKLWTRWNNLSGLGWGTVFPIYTNLAVIAITYAIMSPLILIFATGAFALLYFAYLYSFLYVYNQSIDTGGLIFPRAIWQSFTGLYLLEVCMTGLFGIRTAVPQLVLFAVTIPVTAVYQIFLQWKFKPKLEYIDLSADDIETGAGKKTAKTHSAEENQGSSTAKEVRGTSDSGGKATEGPGVAATQEKSEIPETGANEFLQDASRPRNGQPDRDNFYHPAVKTPAPFIWIPQDPLGISKEEIRDTKAAGDIQITDGGATLDEKNKMMWQEDPPDYEH